MTRQELVLVTKELSSILLLTESDIAKIVLNIVTGVLML